MGCGGLVGGFGLWTACWLWAVSFEDTVSSRLGKFALVNVCNCRQISARWRQAEQKVERDAGSGHTDDIFWLVFYVFPRVVLSLQK